MRIFLAVLLSVMCVGLARCDPTSVAPAPASLTVIAGKNEQVKGNVTSFDFGEWAMWDHSLESKANAGIDPRRLWATGFPKVRVSHVFVLRNEGKKPVMLSKFDVQGEIEEIKSTDTGDLPFRIQPKQEIHLEVFFVYQNTYSGEFAGSVRLLSKDAPQPLATLQLSARVPPVVRLEPAALSFGVVPSSVGAVRQVTLTFDRHIPSFLVPGPFRLVSSNPNVKISALPDQTDLLGVKVNGNSITFPALPDEKPLAKDLKINFAVSIPPGCAVGSLSSTISLIAVETPIVAFVQGVQTKVQASISPT